MSNSNTDVMELFVMMATSIFGSSMAMVIGPYLLIVFAAATGAGWSLGRRESNGKKEAVFYFLRIVFMAVLLTVLIAKISVRFVPDVEVDWLIAPVALIIGLIGDDWYKVIAKLMDFAKKFIDRVLKKKLGE